MLCVSAVLLLAHYVHLEADFPHGSPWVDPARMTDEGWYAGGAIRHFLSGGWRLPGDFNPAVALPVFPAVVYPVFRVTGVSVVALRAMNVSFFGASLVVVCLLMRRYGSPLAAAVAVFLVASNPFFYAYSRLGILEPLLTLEMLLAMLAASYVANGGAGWKKAMMPAAVGVLLAAMVLTKTTGVCAYPAVFFLMASRCDFKRRRALGTMATSAAVAAALCLAYFAVVVRAGLLADFMNLFAINRNRVHASILLPTLWSAAREGVSMGAALYLTAAALVLPSVVFWRRTLPPLVTASVVGLAGFGAFITYHGWLLPRYYLAAVPLVAMAVALVLERISQSKAGWARVAGASAAAVLAVFSISAIRTLGAWTWRPSYGYVEASRVVYRAIDNDPGGNRVVLSSFGQQIALLTAERGSFLNAIYGTADLREMVRMHHPGWMVAFDRMEPQAEAAIKGIYTAELVSSAPAFGDDGIHYRLMLYRLVPTTR
jgi:4-amino-4-deoxy-L-arabinose transferase-like glycosyltransferase